MKKIDILDTTLRDGSQSANVSFTVEDKIKIVKALDDFGISYIEGGWPGSNITDKMFFRRTKKIKFKSAKIVAFGSTRKKGIKASEDKNLRGIISSGVQTACIFGKSWDLHVKYALKTANNENLRMIYESVKYLKSKKIETIFDAEHYFDGFNDNKEYALETIKAASSAGADIICLCETNGAFLPSEIQTIVRTTIQKFPNLKFGIHCHNDSSCAVANSVIAVEEGCVLVQGTINGIGERCGNTDICSVIPDLQIRKKFYCIPEQNLSKLTKLSNYVDEIANLIPNSSLPFVGKNAFAHKAGVHANAVEKLSETYEHIDPSVVGNRRRILVSALSGKSNIASKVDEMPFEIGKSPSELKKIMKTVKDMGHKGYQYENADASFFILSYKTLNLFSPFFVLKNYKVSVEKGADGNIISRASLKLDINGKEKRAVAEGDGPVNALDGCLRKALTKYYPEIKTVRLSDFKVRVINSGDGTEAKVRVLIESVCKGETWGTIGVSENMIDASWQALSDAIEYKLLKDKKGKK
jgi:2-isopropylmalate synthase